ASQAIHLSDKSSPSRPLGSKFHPPLEINLGSIAQFALLLFRRCIGKGSYKASTNQLLEEKQRGASASPGLKAELRAPLERFALNCKRRSVCEGRQLLRSPVP